MSFKVTISFELMEPQREQKWHQTTTRWKTPLLFKRYIDNIILVHHHDLSDLMPFINSFSAFHLKIRFTCPYSATEISFLNITISSYGGKLRTSLCRKPTDSWQNLPFKISHHNHCQLTIPHSQAIHYHEICSDDNDLD